MTPSGGELLIERETLARLWYTVALCAGTVLVGLLIVGILVAGYLLQRGGRALWARYRGPVVSAVESAASLGAQLVGGLELVASALRANLDHAEHVRSAAVDAKAARGAAEALLEGQGRLELKLDGIASMLRGEGEDSVRGSSTVSGAVRVPVVAGEIAAEGARA